MVKFLPLPLRYAPEQHLVRVLGHTPPETRSPSPRSSTHTAPAPATSAMFAPRPQSGFETMPLVRSIPVTLTDVDQLPAMRLHASRQRFPAVPRRLARTS